MTSLSRQTFKTSRLAEFCSRPELVNQTGHAVEDWPLVVLKEPFDNALDGCDEAGIAPEIAAAINTSGITVTDNGPGMAASAIVDITDYHVRVSSREAHGLGTLSVRGYLGEVRDLEISPAGFKDVEIKTHGPHGRFGALLFVEKEGFNDLFRSVRPAERFDIAIMSSKGVSVTAARQLADQLDILLLTLHDFDVAGFTIGRIGEDTDRYTFENDIDVINIGLRLRDVEDLEHDGAVVLDALAETCNIRDDFEKKREALENSGATEEEIDFLLGEGEFEEEGPRRIELNALTSRQLVDLIERRLFEHEIEKVVPDTEDLAEAFRHYTRAPAIREAVERAIESLPADAITVPDDLEARVRDYLTENPECPWEEAVAAIVEQ